MYTIGETVYWAHNEYPFTTESGYEECVVAEIHDDHLLLREKSDPDITLWSELPADKESSCQVFKSEKEAKEFIK